MSMTSSDSDSRWGAPLEWSYHVEVQAPYRLHIWADEKSPNMGFDPQDGDEGIYSAPMMEFSAHETYNALSEADLLLGDVAFVFCRNPNAFNTPVRPVGHWRANAANFALITPEYETFAWLMLYRHFDGGFNNDKFYEWVMAVNEAGVPFDLAAQFAIAGVDDADAVIAGMNNDIDFTMARALVVGND